MPITSAHREAIAAAEERTDAAWRELQALQASIAPQIAALQEQGKQGQAEREQAFEALLAAITVEDLGALETAKLVYACGWDESVSMESFQVFLSRLSEGTYVTFGPEWTTTAWAVAAVPGLKFTLPPLAEVKEARLERSLALLEKLYPIQVQVVPNALVWFEGPGARLQLMAHARSGPKWQLLHPGSLASYSSSDELAEELVQASVYLKLVALTL